MSGYPWKASGDSALSFPNRLAEKYRECLSNKEKILKEIEVKKEYLSSLQPRLNSIMQVWASPGPPLQQPCLPLGVTLICVRVQCRMVLAESYPADMIKFHPEKKKVGQVDSGTYTQIYLRHFLFTQSLIWIKHFCKFFSLPPAWSLPPA